MKDGEIDSGEVRARHAALVRAIADRADRDAFRVLFDHYAPRVKGFLSRQGLDDARAEELAQEVMVVVWRKAASFDPAKASVSTWIFRIARNRRIDVFRRDRTAVLDGEDPGLRPPETPDPQEAADAGQRQGLIARALAQLPAEQQDLIRRAFYDELSHSEIAERTGLALGTVKSRLRLAFAKLRSALGDLA